MTRQIRPVPKVWLDCDPGHDDAIALLLALYLPQVDLVGVSSVNGNAPLVATHANAAQLLALYRAPKTLPLHRGLAKPLKKEYNHPPVSIHGHSGLDGVLNMPPMETPSVQHWYHQFQPADTPGDGTAIPAIVSCLESLPQDEKLTLVVTGPSTNAAAVRLANQELFDAKVEKVVIMGGAFDIPQWTPYAEFNVAVDPESLDILTQSKTVPIVLCPLNCSHQAIFTAETNAKLLDPSVQSFKPGDEYPKPVSKLRESLSTMLVFFRDAYLNNYGFTDGPPLHDALTIMALTHPNVFQGRWCHLTVDTSDTERNGQVKADWSCPETEYQDYDTTSRRGEGKDNCFVLLGLDAKGFFDIFLEVVAQAEKVVETTPI